MTAKLRIELTYKKHPYEDSNSSKFEVWGHLIAKVVSPESEEALFAFDYNLEGLARWFVQTSDRWHERLLPASDGENQSQAFDRLSTQLSHAGDADDEPLIEQLVTELSNFSEYHDLSIAFPGFLLPPIHICIVEGIGEISVAKASLIRDSTSMMIKTGQWRYMFDVDEFKRHLKEEMVAFLQTWIEKSTSDEGKRRFTEILLELTAPK